MKDFNSVRGTREFTPVEMSFRQGIIDKIRFVYQNNGFSLIKTPILERLDFLCRGDSGDNSKIMFKTVKRGAKLDLTKANLTESDIVEEGLRYDLTVPLCRFYCNNKNDLPVPFKSIQIDEAFRAERPQNGRYRQFTQCDVDIFGEASEMGEVELLVTAIDAYKEVGIENVEIDINNRRLLNDIVLFYGFKDKDVNTINISLDKLDKIGGDGVKEELTSEGFHKDSVIKLVDKILQVKNEGFDGLIDLSIDENNILSLKNIINSVKTLRPNANIRFDISIVRGQGYYTGTVYEVYARDLGFRSALGGGGRYDNMVEEFSGVHTPAVGMSIGLDSVMTILKANTDSNKLALIYSDSEIVEVLKMKDVLKEKYNVTIFPKQKNFKSQLDKLAQNKYLYITKMENNVLGEVKNLNI